jgi:2-polyprenyl-6-methoxyphenol hydroxylase-like FAD-dependent oxidoreductase
MRVLISGAGIAGLSLALRLHQRGLVPIVIERSARLRDGGYTPGLSDPGYDAAGRMGIAEALRAAHHVPARLAYLDGEGRERFAIGSRTLDRFVGRRQLSLMRGDVERVLHDRVRAFSEVRFGASIASLDAVRDGVRAVLEDGTGIECDLVVGADGLHSRVRALRFGAEERFLRPLGARVAAFLLDRVDHPLIEPGASHSITEVNRVAALADAGRGRLVAFFIHRAEPGTRRFASIEAELRSAFAGAGWLVPTLLDLLPRADAVYADDVAQIVMPRWREHRTVLIGDAAHAVSLVAGKGATLAMAGGCLLADALADRPGDIDAAAARCEAWIRPMAEAAQRRGRRNLFLFAPANRPQLLLREAVLRFAALRPLAPLAKWLLDREGQRLPR